MTKGKFAHGPLGVIRHIIDVRWKKGLIKLVYASGDVGPPKKGLDVGGTVIDPDL